MPNRLQKFIYNVSAAAPICITFAFVWYILKQTWVVPLVYVTVCLLLVVAFAVSFSYGTRHLAPIPIRTNDISPNDSWFVVYIFTYLLPFASMVVDDFELSICGSLAIIILSVAPFINSAIHNPFLFAKRYHFYQISGENGISGYVLLSKRILRKKQDLKLVNRISDFLLLDVEGR